MQINKPDITITIVFVFTYTRIHVYVKYVLKKYQFALVPTIQFEKNYNYNK